MNNLYVFDLEGDGLTPTKIHVLSVKNLGSGKVGSTADYDTMKRLFLNGDNTLICHNAARFDVPVVERILDIKVKAKVIDTLPLSWYLEFTNKRHGLESWGEKLGTKKPEVEDWVGLSYEEYKHRCESDVEINHKLWELLWGKLLELYESEEEALKFIDYLMFKMDCAREQERSRWKLDVVLCRKSLEEMEALKQEKVKSLAEAMPSVPILNKKTKPKRPYKMDGSYSATGQKWFDILKGKGLDEDYDGTVTIVVGYKEPNPGSVPQVKDWLESLGWKPETFKFVKKDNGEVKQIPQINLERGQGICPSIKKLYEVEPRLEILDGLSILTHRISILKGFLSAMDSEGYVKAEIQGLTNTLRFKHAVCVNLPGVRAEYGKIIRGCLIAPEGYELCGSDMCGLEDRTKQHYMWRFDKEYVKEMMTPDFDPHLSLAVFAGALTKEQSDAHKNKDEDYGSIRHAYKQTNYASTYGARAATIARAAGVSVVEGKALHEAYWKRNWSLKAIPKTIKTKTLFGSMWLKNPVSGFWYSLRAEKDIFSTLNQGTGTYCFDMWVKEVRKKRSQLTGQFHDEIILTVKEGYREECTKLLKNAIATVNKNLKLNRDLDVDVQFGKTYADIH